MQNTIDVITIEKVKQDINNVYRDMGKIKEEYMKILKSHHNVMKEPTVTYDYKMNDFKKSLKRALELKTNYVEAALNQLNIIEGKYSKLSQVEELFKDARSTIVALEEDKNSIFIIGEDGEIKDTRSIETDLRIVCPTRACNI